MSLVFADDNADIKLAVAQKLHPNMYPAEWMIRILQLSYDANRLPDGYIPCAGVEVGCGHASCTACYEPSPVDWTKWL